MYNNINRLSALITVHMWKMCLYCALWLLRWLWPGCLDGHLAWWECIEV